MGCAVRGARRPARALGRARHNLLALGAVAILLPATLWVSFANEWFTFYDAWPSRPIDVAAGQSLEYGGSTWLIESTDRITANSADGRERGLPTGTDLLAVTVRVDPPAVTRADDEALCTTRLEETDGGAPARSWIDATKSPISLTGTQPGLSSCSGEELSPYSFRAEFIVPSDAGSTAGLAIGIAVAPELPDYARFELD